METITERLALLTLDNKHRTLTESTDLRLGYGLCGALVLDLMLCGALTEENAGMLHPRPTVKLPHAYLQEAFNAIPSYTAIDHATLLKSLYEVMPRIKVLVLDRLVDNGILRTETAKLKWSFALKSYTLKQDACGYRDKTIQALLANRVQLPDFWVLELAMASRLLWAEEGDNKKTLHAALAHIAHLQSMNAQANPLMQLVAEGLPAAIADSHKLPPLAKKSKHPLVWEWRGFWADDEATLIQSSQLYKQSLENISFSEMTDVYLVVEGMAENIKLRKGALEVKRPEESLGGYTAFTPKVIYDLPLSPKKALRLFAHVPAPDNKLQDIAAITAHLQAHGVGAKRAEVKKKRFQVKLQSQVKVEFCTLQTGGRKFLSLCVEGPNYDVTAAHSHNFQSGEVMAMGYVEFLKHCQMEAVQ